MNTVALDEGMLANLDWDFHEADTRLLTNSIHRYSGKFIPQIARQAIDLLTRPGDLVFDPYCGSGTTLLEAYVAGRKSLGVDLNPLAILIAKTKVTPVERDILGDLVAKAREIPFEEESGGQLDIWGSGAAAVGSDPRLADPWYTKWFSDSVLRSLVAIDHFIAELDDQRLVNIARVAQSDILRKVSRAHQGFPNVMFDRKRGDYKVSVRSEFLTRLRDICLGVRSLSEAVEGRRHLYAPKVVQGRAENQNVDEGTVDAVVSHPPYIASIPYAEYGLLSLTWLGEDAKALDKELTGGRRQHRSVVSEFRVGYAGMIEASARALKPSGHMFLLTGDPTVRGEIVDLAAMTIEFAEQAGLELEYQAQRVGKNRRANKMDVETVTIWRKS